MSGILSAMERLTPIQARLLRELRRRGEQGDPPPSYRELCATFGWSSSGTARDHLRALARKGHVKLPRHRGGRVRLLSGVPRMRSAPIIGRVSAGIPVLSEENVEGQLPVPAEWGPDDTLFALRVSGDSMEDAGILDGDKVVVRKQSTAKHGEIVVATIDGETTLKRFVERRRRKFLVAENRDYQAIEVRSEASTIHGVVVGLLREYVGGHSSPSFEHSVGSGNRERGPHAHGT